ncbi:MAG: hypothetical protein Q7U57_13060 [Methylovulum sp.]|nr:hypothetical protein [Methylovulum sp.]
MQDRERLKAGLALPWTFVGTMLLMLAAAIIVCHTLGKQVQQPVPTEQIMVTRTVLYAIAIATFPLTNLIRHIQLRLNQTMPLANKGTIGIDDVLLEAKSRYFLTTLISMSLIETIGIFGFVMFVLGDNFNTLYIFTGMSALGLFLYRPKVVEYNGIVEALIHLTR